MPFVRFFSYIVPLQLATALCCTSVIFTLFIGLRIDGSKSPPPDNSVHNSTNPNNNNNNNNQTIPNPTLQPSDYEGSSVTSGEGNFLTYEQLSICILVVLGCILSILAPYRLKPNYRFAMVWIISIAGLVTGISQFIMIGLRGGCKVPYYSQQVSKCTIQLVVSTMDVVWVVLLLTEGALNYQRSVDKDYQTRLREQEEEGSERWRWSITSVVYNPDLSQQEQAMRQQQEEELEAAAAAGGHGSGSDVEGEGGDRVAMDQSDNAGAAAAGESLNGRRTTRRLAVDTLLEMEPLPKYRPKAARGQPRIIDLGNMPPPPSLSPPPSPTEGTSPSTTAGLGTTGTRTDAGAVTGETGTVTGAESIPPPLPSPTTLPPSYSD
ncbi:hypothetical protein BGX29_007759 [Mortierella sp. GBA35]|nr:hypothetical protein BGX29_007759 [Mortierella sp. GBA35]